MAEQNQGDPHRVLGVSPSASERQIRRAYLALAKQHHPDRGGDPARFDEITKAWNQLSALDSGSKSTRRPSGTRRTSRRRPARPAPASPATVRYRPPLSHGPVRVGKVSVDSLLAQQPVHGKIPGGVFRRQHRALHTELSQLLQDRLLPSLPAVRLFHGVKLSRGLTADTVLLGGTKAAVVAAHFAPPDVYTFNGTALHGRKRIELPDLTPQILALQRLLPDHQVGGFCVLFSTTPHAPTIQATDGLNTLGLTDLPASVFDAIRNIKLFIGTGDHSVVDRTAMGHLLSKC